MSREDWVLYVDESGDTSDPNDLHVVAGLLLRSNDPTTLDGPLRRAIARIYPLWPWPPHAAHLNLPASRVAAAMRGSGGSGDRAAELRQLAQPLVDRVVGSQDAAAVAFVEAVRAWSAGGALAWGPLRRGNAWLRARARGTFDRLERECVQQERQVQRLLSGIGATSPGAAVVLAVSPRRSADVDGTTPGKRIQRDRYVRALEVLLARVSWLLAGASPTARLLVATRGVGVAGVRRRRFDLTPAFVADIARSGLSGVRTPDGPTRLEPVGSPNRYDADVAPGIVLADWIANRAHRGLRSPHKEPLQSLVSHGALGLREAPLPVLFAPLRGGNRLPTLGVDGPSRDLIRRAMQGGSVDVSGLDSWVRGVTEPWVRAAAEWTR